jgi:hypothetical protein
MNDELWVMNDERIWFMVSLANQAETQVIFNGYNFENQVCMNYTKISETGKEIPNTLSCSIIPNLKTS